MLSAFWVYLCSSSSNLVVIPSARRRKPLNPAGQTTGVHVSAADPLCWKTTQLSFCSSLTGLSSEGQLFGVGITISLGSEFNVRRCSAGLTVIRAGDQI